MPINPDRAAVSSLVWFPGGQRSPTGELQQFKPGIGALLDRFRVPTVPATVRGKVTVEFGRPLDVDDLERWGEGEGPRDRIARALHDHLAEMIDRS